MTVCMLYVKHLVSCPHLSLRRAGYRNGKLKGLSKEQHGKYSLESEELHNKHYFYLLFQRSSLHLEIKYMDP